MRRTGGDGVLAEVDRREKAGRQRDDHRDRRRQQRAADERQHAEVLVGKERRPDRAEQELGNRHLAEERRRLEQQHQDDPDRDQNRRGRAEKQRALDDELDDGASGEAAWNVYFDSRCSSVTWL